MLSRSLYGLSLIILMSACGQKVSSRSSGSKLEAPSPRQVGEGDAVAKLPGAGTGSTTEGDNDKDAGSDGKPATPEAPIDLRDVQVDAGLRNYAQINATMAALTGVAANTPAVRTVFQEQLANSLPTDNDIKAFLGSHQVSVFKLAVEYCDALVSSQALRSTFFPDLNFGATPTAAFDAAGKEALAITLVTKLWGTKLSTNPTEQESIKLVAALVDDVLVGKTMTDPAVTGAVVTGVCTAVLSAAPVTFY